jgi:Glycosyl transferase family 8
LATQTPVNACLNRQAGIFSANFRVILNFLEDFNQAAENAEILGLIWSILPRLSDCNQFTMAKTMTDRGVLYCATNHIIYLEAALISAMAFRQLNPDIPVTLICDRPIGLPLQDYGISVIELPIGKNHTFASRNLKTQLARLSPYDETLYIDSDILPLKSIAPIWRYLSDADMAMVVDRLPTVAECDHIDPVERDYTIEFLAAQSLPSSTTQFNSGVMLWQNNCNTQKLFEQWQQEWLQFQKQDQLALVRAIAKNQWSTVVREASPLESGQSPVIAQLPVNYNISPIDSAPVLLPKNEVYLLHCWGGQVASGEYRRIAMGFYPQIVEAVAQMLLMLPQAVSS